MNEIEKLIEEKKIGKVDTGILRKIMIGKKLQSSSECERLERYRILKKISPAEQSFNVYEINKKFVHDVEEYLKKQNKN